MVKTNGSKTECSLSGQEDGLEMVLSSNSRLSKVDTDNNTVEENAVFDLQTGLRVTANDDDKDEGEIGENINTTERTFDKYIIKPITDIVSPIATVGEKVAEHTIGHVIPKIERIPWKHFIFLSLIVAVPATSYIIGFTRIGYGLDTFFLLSRYFEEHVYILALGLAGFAFLLYLLDFHYWQSKCGVFTRYLAIAILILGAAVLICFMSATHPYGPISIYVILTPMWLVLSKQLFYRHLEMRTYVPWLSGPLFFNAMVVLSLWLYWTFDTNAHELTDVTKLLDAQVSGCVPNFEKYPDCETEDLKPGSRFEATRGVCFKINQFNPEMPKATKDCPEYCTKVYDNCPNVFIIWVGPFLVSLGLFFLSFFATFLKATGTMEQEAIKFAKIWFFLLFTLWIASSLAGAGAGVSTTLAALTLSAFVASAILLASSFTHIERKEKVFQLWSSLVEKYRSYLNVAKGLLVVTSAPVFVLYLTVSFLHQIIRNVNLFCPSKTPTNTESLRSVMGEGFVTNEARRLIREVKSWDLVEVFKNAIYSGIILISFFNIAPQFTTLMLSWIIEKTSSMSIPMVTAILLLVGVIMFLLPPVPGAPIYLTFGIVIVPIGRESWGITYSILYAMGVSLLLKLFATVLQQKMIGGLLKGNVGIRRAIGINTSIIRSFKLILSERGLGLAKVSILCGGPDWPTSVFCGVMDLALLPVLVGTIPVLALIAPTVLSGSFMYMGSLKLDNGEPEFSWVGTANTVSVAVAFIVLFGFMFLSAFYVEKTIRERKDEIDAIPIDEEVKVYEDKAAAGIEAYKEVTQWFLVPVWAKIILICSLVTIITSFYMLQLFYEEAFTQYELTSTIDEHLDGDWKNLVRPLGQVALILFVVSTVLVILFNSWANRATKVKLEEKQDIQEDLELQEGYHFEPSTSKKSQKSILKKGKSLGRLSHVDEDIGVTIYATRSS